MKRFFFKNIEMVYCVGINGFGRIGKCIFMQLLENPDVEIRCINAPILEMKYVEQYLKYDSVHHYSRNFYFKIIDEDNFEISMNERRQRIHIFRDRNASNLLWRNYNVDFVFDCTGSYLTQEKCKEHNVDFVMMSAPAKDSTKTFVYGVNHKEYKGESIVSSASCTTNCITPVLKWLQDNLGILHGNFTTIHSTTASQHTVDILNKNARTNRCILNNIIPHTTGASSAISAVIPELKGLIHGTSLRVPVSNVSLVDLNVECRDTSKTLHEVLEMIKELDDERDEVIHVTKDTLVSCDFLTTTHPSIIDSKASLDMGNGKYKFMIWYDNEWSYSAQMIRLFLHMMKYRDRKQRRGNPELKDRSVNIPLNLENMKLNETEESKIQSFIHHLQEMLDSQVRNIHVCVDLRKSVTKEYIPEVVIPLCKKHIDVKIGFLETGMDRDGFDKMENEKDCKIWMYQSYRHTHLSKKTNHETTQSYSFENADFYSQRVILRVDMNVPIQNGIITDDYRITSILPTLKTILQNHPKRVILVSHLGRPNGWDEEYSLRIVVPVLEKYLGEKVGFLEKGMGEESEKKMEEELDCRIWVMENIRFYKEETDYEKKEISEEFQNQLLQMGDVYVNDAFGCSHRKHFSICGFSGRMPCYYGKCIQKELDAFDEILENPENKKIFMILGGAKIDDKIPILQKLCKKVKTIYLGGGILSNLIEGMNQKNKDALDEAKKHCNLIIATDGINQNNDYLRWNYKISSVSPENKIFDIGTQSLHELYQLIQQHDIVLWNGTMGWTEKGFIQGTDSLISILQQSSCQVIVGGGDTAGYVNQKKHSFYHVSTGGGASIEYISQGSLIGLDSIFDS